MYFLVRNDRDLSLISLAAKALFLDGIEMFMSPEMTHSTAGREVITDLIDYTNLVINQMRDELT